MPLLNDLLDFSDHPLMRKRRLSTVWQILKFLRG